MKGTFKFISVAAITAFTTAVIAYQEPHGGYQLPTFSRRVPERPQAAHPLPNGGFEKSGGWESNTGAPIQLIADPHSGQKACRLRSSLVKTQLIPLAPGEQLQFEAWTKVDALRTIIAEVAFFGKKREWLKSGSGQLARGDQYSWQRITGSFENTRSDVHFVALQFYGSGVLDDVKIWKLKAAKETGDEKKAKLNIVLPRENTKELIFLGDENLEAWISKQTGMLVKLDSLKPTRKTIQPAGMNSMQLYLHTQQQPGIDGDFNRVVKMEEPEQGVWKFTLTSSNRELAELADAEITYTFKDGRLDVAAEIIAKKDDSRPFQIGLRSVFRADEWKRNILASWPVQGFPAATRLRSSFHYAPNDSSSNTIGIIRLPFSVLEGTDRFLLLGSFDLGRFTCFSPNDIAWRLPSQQMNPKTLSAGEKFRFDSVYAVFPKANHEFTQVMRYYIDHVYSSMPLMKDLVKRQDSTDRYFTEGAFAWYHPGSIPNGWDGWRKEMLDRRANNVWYSWWANWDEVYPTEGNWYTYDLRRLSAPGIQSEIDYMKKMDLNVYLYFRQFLVEDGTFEDRPPYKKWLGRDAEGKRMPFMDYPVPQPKLLGGVNAVRWTLADFGDPEFREWYIEMVKRAIDYYKPTGICWDMGYSSYWSHNAPEVGIGQGTLYVQGKIYEYLKEKYPDMRIAVNEAFCSPTSLFGDAILIEGAWDVAKKSELDYQAARAFDAVIFSLQLTDDYIIQGIPETQLDNYTHLEVKARGTNLADAKIFGSFAANGFRADGTWQTIRIPVGRKSYRTYNISVTANDAGNGMLEIAEAKFVSPNDPTRKPIVMLKPGTAKEHFIFFGKWSHINPTTGRVQKTADGFSFTADQPNGTRNWSNFTDVFAKWIKYQLKVTALGAVCSDAQIPTLKELNEFGAKVAAMRHLSAKKLIYNAPQRVYGTFWQRDERCGGAIYNENGHTCDLKLQLDKAAFPNNGKALLAGKLSMFTVNAKGETVSTDKFQLKDQGNYISLTGSLAGGSLLVIYNW